MSEGHSLSGDSGETGQEDVERKRQSVGDSPSGDSGGRGESRKVTECLTEQGQLETEGRNESRHRKKVIRQGALTSWELQRKGQVGTQKEAEKRRKERMGSGCA